MRGRNLTSEQIRKIREGILSGNSKYQVAKELGLSTTVVYRYTKDIPNSKPGNSGIRGKTLDLLKELLQNGYVYSNRDNSCHFHTIRKHFPVIQRAQIDGKSIYFLDDKNKIALKAMLESRKSRVITFHDLARMSKVFDVNLSITEKYSYLGKKEKRMVPIIRKKEGGFMSSYKKSQTNLFDFMAENAFLGKSDLLKRQKNHRSEEDSLQENGGSLVEFYIRMI
jgi:hypothetical protein